MLLLLFVTTLLIWHFLEDHNLSAEYWTIKTHFLYKYCWMKKFISLLIEFYTSFLQTLACVFFLESKYLLRSANLEYSRFLYNLSRYMARAMIMFCVNIKPLRLPFVCKDLKLICIKSIVYVTCLFS
jgi:hypothetical protein